MVSRSLSVWRFSRRASGLSEMQESLSYNWGKKDCLQPYIKKEKAGK